MEFRPYFLVGDVVKSANISDKPHFENSLENICSNINKKYSSDFYISINITEGINQIAGALKSIKNIYYIVDHILDELYPQKMRFILCQDKILNDTLEKNISRIYGPVIDKSQQMMKNLKNTDFVIDIDLNDPLNDSALRWQMNFIFHIKSNWSGNKRIILKEYEKLKNQQKVAEKISISQQAVSKNIKSSHSHDLKLIESDLIYNLKNFPVLKDISAKKDLTLEKWL